MKFVCSSDWHLSTKGPVTRKDDWVETMFGKMDQLALIARKVKARAILNAGDTFTKDSRVDWLLMGRLIDWCYQLRKDGIDVITVPGNHDLRHDRLDTVPSQPIGLLFKTGAMIDVSFNFHLYVDDSGTRVAIGGIPYPAAYNLESYRALVRPDADRAIVLAHCFATPSGGDYYGEPIISYKDLTQLQFDAYVFGHDHSDNGVVSIVGLDGRPNLFVNHGALSRGSISRENTDRIVKATILDATKDNISAAQVALRVRPAAEVFDLALKAQKDHEESRVEEFVDRLNNDLVNTGDLDITDRVARMDLQPVVREKVRYYISEAERIAGNAVS